MADKKVALNISERIAALGILNAFKGDLDKLATILEDIKQLPLTDEEWEKAEKVVDKIDNEKSQIRWNDEKGGEKEVEFQSATVDYVRTTIKERSDKKELSLQDHAFIKLLSKLD